MSPAHISETGYRYYNEKNLETLQQILFFRELDFSLKEMIQIMHSPNYNKEEALMKQKELLISQSEVMELMVQGMRVLSSDLATLIGRVSIDERPMLDDDLAGC